MKARYDKPTDLSEADVQSASNARPDVQSALGVSDMRPALQPPCGGAIYTPEQRMRRDTTIWTPVQGVLAALQFAVFLISLGLVLHFILSGEGYYAASISVCLKTAVLLAIMVTGSLWEKAVFGQYLFARSFFWEDVVSFGVIALHLLYVAAFVLNLTSAQAQMIIALAAYAAYIVNAAQFLWKFRQARGGQRAGAVEALRPQPNEVLLSSGASRGRVVS